VDHWNFEKNSAKLYLNGRLAVVMKLFRVEK
jgi:hypothetical protein